VDGMPAVEGGKNLKEIKSVKALGFQKGLGVFPTNTSVEVPEEKIVTYKGEKPKDAVRNGTW
jgi:Icc-related predicted phosphoesterase